MDKTYYVSIKGPDGRVKHDVCAAFMTVINGVYYFFNDEDKIIARYHPEPGALIEGSIPNR